MNMSYVAETYQDEKLKFIDTKRFAFSTYYKVLFNENGKRIYTIYETESGVEIEHPAFRITIVNKRDETELKIYSKQGVKHG